MTPGGFALSPQSLLGEAIVGAVGLEGENREKPGKSPQFDHASIRSQVRSISCVPQPSISKAHSRPANCKKTLRNGPNTNCRLLSSQ
jgi:hypothetical protein